MWHEKSTLLNAAIVTDLHLISNSELNLNVNIFVEVMVPYDYTEFVDTLTSLVNQSFIPNPMSRIDDAVTRILQVKFTEGFFECPYADYSFVNEVGRQVSKSIYIAHAIQIFLGKKDGIVNLASHDIYEQSSRRGGIGRRHVSHILEGFK
ncbi:hypothetical protein RHSIM_Rhsim10G0054200 [Rhododendron simsii]|uniref:beta-glucosidase n=1 Tax=Rhododendron simsii TaxID=118357 RepID=A0A834GFP5_RHOSS|nr:hypothetical protein RHSIM_Rhsim10G0054200 [Rhododendron simsii]